jgi:hypothetical protein
MKLRRIMEVQRIFIVDLVFKSNFQFYHQIRFHFTCKCKISGFQKVNMWIEWLVIVHKYQLVHFFVWKHFQSAVKMPTIQKMHYVSIWLARMPSICHASITRVGNLFCFECHQNKAHLQFLTSIGYWQH